ncbi:MAG TPA: DUF6314 family protein [Streptomyces sp.]|nr:DUF6314 family protein [Streptomyces sp.]
MGAYRPVADVLAYLSGRWLVRRSVRDLANGLDGEFRGRTDFLPREGGGLLHRETGTFVWQGVGRPAGRTLRFLPGAAGAPGTADVCFADGRPFHDLDLTTGRHVARHPCSADLYRGEFTALDADRWRAVWRVAGPAKDLLLTTDYTRERAGARPADGGYTRDV